MKNQSVTLKNHKYLPGTTKNQRGTLKNPKNPPGTMKNQPGTLENHKQGPRTMNDRRACALRALGLLLADGAPTVGGGKTF